MNSTELLRSIYYDMGQAKKAEEKLKKTCSPADPDYKNRLAEREVYWIDNNKKCFIRKVKALGLFDFCKELHRIVEKPGKGNCTLETDDFYGDRIDMEGVWIILRYQQRRIERLNSIQRLEEWKRLTDMLDSWSKRFYKSFSQYAKERKKANEHYSAPWPDEKYKKRKDYYSKWGIDKPEKERERIQQLLVDVKKSLWKKYELPDIPDFNDEQITMLCKSCQDLREYGIEVTDIEILLERDSSTLKTAFRSLEKLLGAVSKSSSTSGNQGTHGVRVDGIYRYCRRQGKEVQLSQELKQSVYNVYTSVIGQTRDKYSIKDRIAEKVNSGDICNRGDKDTTLLESDGLVQLEYLEHIVDRGIVAERLKERIHTCIEQAKRELINAYTKDTGEEVDFDIADIALERCIYSPNTASLLDGLRGHVGKPLKR